MQQVRTDRPVVALRTGWGGSGLGGSVRFRSADAPETREPLSFKELRTAALALPGGERYRRGGARARPGPRIRAEPCTKNPLLALEGLPAVRPGWPSSRRRLTPPGTRNNGMMTHARLSPAREPVFGAVKEATVGRKFSQVYRSRTMCCGACTEIRMYPH